MSRCNTPEWMLLELCTIIDESDLGRKGLAGRLDVSEAQLSYWLTGREQFPLLRFRQAVGLLGPDHGRRMLNLLAPSGFFASSAVRAYQDENLTRAAAKSMRAEGRLIDDLCAALKDGEITRAEANRLVREADDVESLCEGIKDCIRRRARQ